MVHFFFQLDNFVVANFRYSHMIQIYRIRITDCSFIFQYHTEENRTIIGCSRTHQIRYTTILMITSILMLIVFSCASICTDLLIWFVIYVQFLVQQHFSCMTWHWLNHKEFLHYNRHFCFSWHCSVDTAVYRRDIWYIFLCSSSSYCFISESSIIFLLHKSRH